MFTGMLHDIEFWVLCSFSECFLFIFMYIRTNLSWGSDKSVYQCWYSNCSGNWNCKGVEPMSHLGGGLLSVIKQYLRRGCNTAGDEFWRRDKHSHRHNFLWRDVRADASDGMWRHLWEKKIFAYLEKERMLCGDLWEWISYTGGHNQCEVHVWSLRINILYRRA